MTQESVHCLNIIDIVFADDKTVRDAWKDLYDKYCVQNPDAAQLKKIQNAQYKLLETISKSLGYKGKVTWETIQNPYVPDGMIKQWQEQAKSQQAYNTLFMDEYFKSKQSFRRMYIKDIFLLPKSVPCPKNFLNAIVRTAKIFSGFTRTEVRALNISQSFIRITLENKSHFILIMSSEQLTARYG